jgi:hypothetical protein
VVVTAGGPGYTFSGDTDTGLFSPSAGVLGLSTNGTERFRVAANGSVGIGSTSPTCGSLLDINGTGAGFSSILIPRDTTAFRPTGVNGMIRYNTTTQKFEVYEGLWQNMISAGGGAGELRFSLLGLTYGF